MKYITEGIAEALFKARKERDLKEKEVEIAEEKVVESKNPEDDSDDITVEINGENIEDIIDENKEVNESAEDGEEQEKEPESEEDKIEAPVDESVEEKVEIIGESINYKKIANDILDDWDELVKKGGSDNMKKAVMDYVKKNKNKIDFEDFDYNKFDKEAQNIVDWAEASANKNYKKGSIPWYDYDVQIGLGNSNTVSDCDWYDWFDDALNESTEQPTPESTRKVYSIDEDKWVTINGTHVLIDDNGGIKNEKLKRKIEASK